MKVELTEEQIKFIQQLCFNADNDYENYSPEELAHRVSLADDICDTLDNAVDDSGMTKNEAFDELVDMLHADWVDRDDDAPLTATTYGPDGFIRWQYSIKKESEGDRGWEVHSW